MRGNFENLLSTSSFKFQSFPLPFRGLPSGLRRGGGIRIWLIDLTVSLQLGSGQITRKLTFQMRNVFSGALPVPENHKKYITTESPAGAAATWRSHPLPAICISILPNLYGLARKIEFYDFRELPPLPAGHPPNPPPLGSLGARSGIPNIS